MEITPHDIATAYSILLARPHEVVDVAFESEDLDDFETRLMAKLGATKEQAKIIAAAPLQRMTIAGRATILGPG